MKTKSILAATALSLTLLVIACKKDNKTPEPTPATTPAPPPPAPVDNATPLVGIYSGTLTFENRYTGAIDAESTTTVIGWKVSKVDNNTVKIESYANNAVLTGSLQLGPINAVITKTTDALFTGGPYYKLSISNFTTASAPSSTLTGVGSSSNPSEHGYYATSSNATKFFAFSVRATNPQDSSHYNFSSIKP